MTKNKACRLCRGPVEAKKVEHPYWHGANLVAVVRDVPSWVCRLCGHQYFEPAVETTLSYIVQDYVKMGKLFPIPSTPYRTVRDIES